MDLDKRVLQTMIKRLNEVFFGVDISTIKVYFHSRYYATHKEIREYKYNPDEKYLDRIIEENQKFFVANNRNLYDCDCIVYSIDWEFNGQKFMYIFYVDQAFMDPDNGIIFRPGYIDREDIISVYAKQEDIFLIVKS